jgi:hypothetical protein
MKEVSKEVRSTIAVVEDVVVNDTTTSSSSTRLGIILEYADVWELPKTEFF